MIACICGGTVELLAAGVVLGVGATLWDRIALKYKSWKNADA